MENNIIQIVDDMISKIENIEVDLEEMKKETTDEHVTITNGIKNIEEKLKDMEDLVKQLEVSSNN